jgi:GT2 family glycosyltransferase
MTVSIIIAVKGYCGNLKECVNNSFKIFPVNFEIIILPDEIFENGWRDQRVKIIPTGNVAPPVKRDIGVREAKGEIIAFLDDDTYPAPCWLDAALKLFEGKDIACVCGPAVTPDDDSLLQKASGIVYESYLVSGGHNFRYIPKPARFVDDFPSCNFLIRRDIFEKVGGFDTKFWPGEDTFLCLKVKQAGKKMLYHPAVLVYHHRRGLFAKHLKQIINYGLHRGYFARKFPETSLRITYFIPSLLLLWLISGIFSGLSAKFAAIYFLSVLFYLGCVMAGTILVLAGKKEKMENKIKLIFLVFSGIIATHLAYGIYFIKGLMASSMPEETADDR